jgi:hypothetical protein
MHTDDKPLGVITSGLEDVFQRQASEAFLQSAPAGGRTRNGNRKRAVIGDPRTTGWLCEAVRRIIGGRTQYINKHVCNKMCVKKSKWGTITK